MTLIDTRHFYLENEDLVESREIEREELKEGAEGRDWVVFLMGGNSLFLNEFSYHLKQFTPLLFQGITRHYSLTTRTEVDLFLKFCCLKVHFI